MFCLSYLCLSSTCIITSVAVHHRPFTCDVQGFEYVFFQEMTSKAPFFSRKAFALFFTLGFSLNLFSALACEDGFDVILVL